ncbi:MAG: YicC/YloC family endoribonuclease [Pseudomonadota bacterium]
MIRSMTGFAANTGSAPPHAWSWELRGVNGKGQDLRVRVPDWIDGLEAGLRRKLAASTDRGNITLSLRLTRDETAATYRLQVQQLDAVLAALAETEARAGVLGLGLAPSSAAEVLGMRGVMEPQTEADDSDNLAKTLLTEADDLIASFNEMRASEGHALSEILRAQLEAIAALTAQAAEIAQDRAAAQTDMLRRNLARVLDNADGADPDRVAQELALLAVKSDITEEIDRLDAHVGAARDLLAQGGPVGRKLDFLMQEFNREANTLCAKAQHKELTTVGLALKATIDQMREQVQNVE